MPTEKALLAAIIEGARLCHVDDHLERSAQGCIFDAIAFTSEPDMTSLAIPAWYPPLSKVASRND